MRIAHCSDLHLLSHAGAGWLKLVNKRWIGALNLLSSRSRHHHVAAFEDMVADLNELGVDHVLCTGDVTNLALRQEFEFARGKFDQLALGPAAVTVIPGNHDAYVAEGVPLFSELFGDYATTDPGWEWADDHRHDADDILHWPIVRVRGPIAIVGLSTSRATPWFTAYGRIGPGQLARLQHVLEKLAGTGVVRIVAIHHPVTGARAASRIRGLRDHQELARVIAHAGAELVVHGHEHRDIADALAGPHGEHVPVRGVVSGTYWHVDPARAARYRIFEVEDGKLARAYARVWDREARRFVADAGTSEQLGSGALDRGGSVVDVSSARSTNG